MKKLIVIIFCCLGMQCLAQDINTKTERKAFKLVLAVDKTMRYESSIKAGPYILENNMLQIYPGEKLLVEIEQSEGYISSMTVVKKNLHPDRTIELHFTQAVNKLQHQSMKLRVVNPFKKELTYNAKLFLWKTNHWVDGNVSPVAAGSTATEKWNDIVVTIAFGGWKFSQ